MCCLVQVAKQLTRIRTRNNLDSLERPKELDFNKTKYQETIIDNKDEDEIEQFSLQIFKDYKKLGDNGNIEKNVII